MKIIDSAKTEIKDLRVGDILKLYDVCGKELYRMIIDCSGKYNMITLKSFNLVYYKDYDSIEELISYTIKDWNSVEYIKHDDVNMIFNNKLIKIK